MSNLNFDVCLAHFYKILAKIQAFTPKVAFLEEAKNGLLICIMVIKWPFFDSSKNATLSLNAYISFKLTIFLVQVNYIWIS